MLAKIPAHQVCLGDYCVTDENFLSIEVILAVGALFALPLLYYIF